MRKSLTTTLVAAILLTGIGLGCGGEPSKGIYKDKDKPEPEKKEEKKKDEG